MHAQRRADRKLRVHLATGAFCSSLVRRKMPGHTELPQDTLEHSPQRYIARYHLHEYDKTHTQTHTHIHLVKVTIDIHLQILARNFHDQSYLGAGAFDTRHRRARRRPDRLGSLLRAPVPCCVRFRVCVCVCVRARARVFVHINIHICVCLWPTSAGPRQRRVSKTTDGSLRVAAPVSLAS